MNPDRFLKNKQTQHPPTLPLEKCLAKTYQDAQKVQHPGYNVLQHGLMVGLVARELCRLLPFAVRQALIPDGVELAAAIHDLGKVHPGFQKKLHQKLSQGDQEFLGQVKNLDPKLEREWGYHSATSFYAAKGMGLSDRVARLLGRHHGFGSPISPMDADVEVLGGPLWQERRAELVECLKAQLGCDWPQVQSSAQENLLSGLVTVADWIGSGPLFEVPRPDWTALIPQAVQEAGFQEIRVKPGLSFEEVFKTKEGQPMQPLPAQLGLIQAVQGPGTYLLEAPMGLGKTEAALYAAYRMLEQGQASGLYFALPTQLTSEKVQERVEGFLQAILHPGIESDALLLHSQAWLKELGVQGEPGQSWFSPKKRRILAPFGVGTLDQALMAILHVRHNGVRSFGLAGKVVILDEVHSYDAYTGTLLDLLVEELRQAGATVIILSATLTQSRLQSLLKTPQAGGEEYPLVTTWPCHQPKPLSQALPAPADAAVAIKTLADPAAAQNEALLRARQGQQVLWIENTVAQAQQTYREFALLGSDLELGLIHSRFLQSHRQSNEAHWTHLLGKAGHQARQAKGRILIGTQVLEQSLDLDADFMVSRFCPTDMLLQRLGRLWRHGTTPRSAQAKREAWVLAPPLEQAQAEPQEAFGSSFWVYSPYVLCRSLEAWQALDRVNLPSGIRPLLQATYAQRQEQGPLQTWWNDLQKKQQVLRSKALLGATGIGGVGQDEEASTRLMERPTVSLLLVESMEFDPELQATLVTLPGGEALQLPLNHKELSHNQWRSRAGRLALHCLTLPVNQAPAPLSAAWVERLKSYLYFGPKSAYDQCRVAILETSGKLKAVEGGQASSSHELFYHPLLGYQAEPLHKR